MKILIVDDEFDSIQPFKIAIDKAYPAPSNSVVWCTNIRRASEILRQPSRPDLIILDIMLRRVEDPEFEDEDANEPIDLNAGVDFIRDNGPWLLVNTIPVIVLTNRKSKEIISMINELRFKKLDDDGGELLDDDGQPQVIPFPKEQIRVYTKLAEIMPGGVVNLISELLAIYRPLD